MIFNDYGELEAHKILEWNEDLNTYAILTMFKWVHRNLSENHCPECLALDGCWFAGNNHPRHPHYPYCHCVLEDLPYERVLNDATSYSSYSKFDPFLFNTKGEYSHGKEKLFKAWDIQWMIRNTSGKNLKGRLCKSIFQAIIN